MQHSFDIEIAQKYGVPVAIFLNNLSFWIKKNQANRKHFHDGRYWTYNSVEAYSELFPYWTAKQIRLILDKAKENGLILTANYNLTAYDRTQWYALSDEGHKLLGISICPNGQMELDKRANGFPEKGKPIPDNKTDIKTDNITNRESIDIKQYVNEHKKTSLPDDFSFDTNTLAKVMEECRKKGWITVELIKKFRFKCKDSGKLSADWNAALLAFVLDEKPKISNSHAKNSGSSQDFDPNVYIINFMKTQNCTREEAIEYYKNKDERFSNVS